jgi:hypothetical protein
LVVRALNSGAFSPISGILKFLSSSEEADCDLLLTSWAHRPVSEKIITISIVVLFMAIKFKLVLI